jgi:hypothetical protein
MYKECPWCFVMTQLTHGCNKIHCGNCKKNWCFYCGLKLNVKGGNSCIDPVKHKKQTIN